ncbi:hypothetical protein SH449x_001954 [Pirellulaceae bacterium SH449]
MNQPLKKYVDVDWTAEIDALIGTVPDRVVAERYGIAIRSVHTRRRNLKVESKVGKRTDAPRFMTGPKTKKHCLAPSRMVMWLAN